MAKSLYYYTKYTDCKLPASFRVHGQSSVMQLQTFEVKPTNSSYRLLLGELSNYIIPVKTSFLITSGKKRDTNFKLVMAISKLLFSAAINMS